MVVEKKWALFGGVILLTLIAFIAANKYLLYPRLTAQVLPFPPYSSPIDNPNIVVIKPFEGTLNKIISDPVSDTASTITNPRRNPFLKPGELTPTKKTEKAKKVQPVEIPRLGMIITGENNKTAMLDDSLVHTGETYGGHVVESISSEFIILSGEYGVLKISMLPTSYGLPKVEILEEKNPDLLIEPVFSDKRRAPSRQ